MFAVSHVQRSFEGQILAQKLSVYAKEYGSDESIDTEILEISHEAMYSTLENGFQLEFDSRTEIIVSYDLFVEKLCQPESMAQENSLETNILALAVKKFPADPETPAIFEVYIYNLTILAHDMSKPKVTWSLEHSIKLDLSPGESVTEIFLDTITEMSNPDCNFKAKLLAIATDQSNLLFYNLDQMTMNQNLDLGKRLGSVAHISRWNFFKQGRGPKPPASLESLFRISDPAQRNKILLESNPDLNFLVTGDSGVLLLSRR